ncbi:hypothetical protein EAF00_008429 [Botryotinia globosa]|nr:hypothetical protein EAF00_008429 [Botryotinia globosa]
MEIMAKYTSIYLMTLASQPSRTSNVVVQLQIQHNPSTLAHQAQRISLLTPSSRFMLDFRCHWLALSSPRGMPNSVSQV